MPIMMGIDVSKKTMNVVMITETSTIMEYKHLLKLWGLETSMKSIKLKREANWVYSCRLETYIVQNGLRYRLMNPLVAKKESIMRVDYIKMISPMY